MNYLDWIDQEITRHQTEIARLTVARSVIEDASKAVRLSTPKQALPNPEKKKRYSSSKGETRGYIFTAMRELGRPATPKEITAVVQVEHPEIAPKVIWNALYNARKRGEVLRGAEGYYLLPAPQAAAA